MRAGGVKPVKLAAIIALSACTGLIAACEDGSTDPARDQTDSAGLRAVDPACRLPLHRFAPTVRELVGTYLGIPTVRVDIAPNGRLTWNFEPIEQPRYGEYLRAMAAQDPPVLILFHPHPDAPCAAARHALVVAVRDGRCTARTCVFELPGAGLPPPPPPEPDR